jgi:hypothetical protein
MPAIVLGELRYGYQGAAKAVENEAKLDQFVCHDGSIQLCDSHPLRA